MRALVKFREEHGHIEVPAVYKSPEGGCCLYNWMVSQREHFRRGQLPEPLVTRLAEELDFNLKGEGSPFGYRTKSKDRKRKRTCASEEKLDCWETRYSELETHIIREGTLYNLDEDTSFGRWANKQRLLYKENRLWNDRKERLTALGFDLESKKARKEVPWDQRFEELKKIKRKYGHDKVPLNYKNTKLYFWCSNQRNYYKKFKLLPEREKLLKSIGFSFQKESNSIDSNRNHSSKTPEACTEQKCIQQRRVSKEADWVQKFQKLLEYKERYGDVHVPQRYNADKLGTFVHAQRNAYKNGTLSGERIEKLESIGF